MLRVWASRIRETRPVSDDYTWKQANAHLSVHAMIRWGFLFVPDYCSLCGKPCKPHAHHPDYDNPLKVEWLCKTCHRTEHSFENEYRRPKDFVKEFYF